MIKPLIGGVNASGNSLTPAPPVNTVGQENAVAPSSTNTVAPNTNTVVPAANVINPSSPLPIEGFSDTVTLKNGIVYRNVKATIKETTVLITAQDGKTMEINKSELVSIKK